ncbi:MAG: phosphate transport system protein [Planctomycetota bacterium]|jgi:phosphate transport system protein
MSIHMQRHMDKVKRMLFTLAGDVEHSLSRAVQAVESRDARLAKEVLDEDDKIDAAEIEIEEECLYALALEQPRAMDLRFVVAVLKMNNDLERIGDLASNIAQQAIHLSKGVRIELSEFLPGMAPEVLNMLRGALDALLQMDVEQADAVRSADDRVDEIHKNCFRLVENSIRADPVNCGAYISVLTISRNLERAADLATNIAEDVIYLVRGEIQRHKSDLVEPQ